MLSMEIFKTILDYPVNNFLATGIKFERDPTLVQTIQKNQRYYEQIIPVYLQGLEHAAVRCESAESSQVRYWQYYKDRGLVYELVIDAPRGARGLLKIGARLIPARRSKSQWSKYFEWDEETPTLFDFSSRGKIIIDELSLDAIVKGYNIIPGHLRTLMQEKASFSHARLEKYATRRWNSLHVHLLQYSYDKDCDTTLATYLFNPTTERREEIVEIYSQVIYTLRTCWPQVQASMEILNAAFTVESECSTSKVFAKVEASRKRYVQDLCHAANEIITTIRSKHTSLLESFAQILTL